MEQLDGKRERVYVAGGGGCVGDVGTDDERDGAGAFYGDGATDQLEGDANEDLQEDGGSEEGDLRDGWGRGWMTDGIGSGRKCLTGACHALCRDSRIG